MKKKKKKKGYIGMNLAKKPKRVAQEWGKKSSDCGLMIGVFVPTPREM